MGNINKTKKFFKHYGIILIIVIIGIVWLFYSNQADREAELIGLKSKCANDARLWIDNRAKEFDNYYLIMGTHYNRGEQTCILHYYTSHSEGSFQELVDVYSGKFLGSTTQLSEDGFKATVNFYFENTN